MFEISRDQFNGKDAETGKDLANPYVMICLAGSKRHGVPVNASTLLDSGYCPDIPRQLDRDGRGSEITDLILGNSERRYSILSITSGFSDDGPATPNNQVLQAYLIGFIPEDNLHLHFPKVHQYFNPSGQEVLTQLEDNNPIPEDDVPF